MEQGSTSQCSWADEVEEEECSVLSGLNPNAAPFFGSSSLTASDLNPDAQPFFGGSSPVPSWVVYGEKLSFTDSEADYDSEPDSPVPEGKGKVVAEGGGRLRRLRRR
jgi:hypothetical protein